MQDINKTITGILSKLITAQTYSGYLRSHLIFSIRTRTYAYRSVNASINLNKQKIARNSNWH